MSEKIKCPVCGYLYNSKENVSCPLCIMLAKINSMKHKMVTCKKCGKMFDASERSCPHCKDSQEKWITDYEGRCGNCQTKLEPNDKYCRICGTKRGAGSFKPYQNMMTCIYGPRPVEREYYCKVCSYSWRNIGMIEDKYCPNCGNEFDVDGKRERQTFERFLAFSNDAEQEALNTEWLSDTIVYEAWKNLDKNVKGYFYYPSNESEDSKIYVNEHDPAVYKSDLFKYIKRENGKSFYYKPQQEIGSVNYLKEAFPDVVISAIGTQYLHKKYDAQITLVKGVRRYILDQENKVWGAFEFVSSDRFRCIHPNGMLEVRVGGYGWTVYLQGKKAATIRYWKPPKRARRKKNEHDEERCFQLVIAKELPEECYSLLFAIPVIGF